MHNLFVNYPYWNEFAHLLLFFSHSSKHSSSYVYYTIHMYYILELKSWFSFVLSSNWQINFCVKTATCSSARENHFSRSFNGLWRKFYKWNFSPETSDRNKISFHTFISNQSLQILPGLHMGTLYNVHFIMARLSYDS